MNPVDKLGAALSSIPGTEATQSRFGSGRKPAWRVAGCEFAHLHSDTLLDLRLPRAAQQRLRTDPRAHFRTGASQWLELEFHSEQDVDDLLVLAREAAAAARAQSK